MDRSGPSGSTDPLLQNPDPPDGGDHKAHAKRILDAHLQGGFDQIGFFSTEQRCFIAEVNGIPGGMIHLVGKRQRTYKISPLIVSPEFQMKHGLGSILLNFGEEYARKNRARQIYCTVARENKAARDFFIKRRYVPAGASFSHYKKNITELMFYKVFPPKLESKHFETPHISVLPAEPQHYTKIRQLLKVHLKEFFDDVDDAWIDALLNGYERRSSLDINQKYKLLFVALNRKDQVLGVAGATPKKGLPIKIMPLIAPKLPAFEALVIELPFLLREHGHKLYVHIVPNAGETMVLQKQGWRLDAALPKAYHEYHITQQWSIDLDQTSKMKLLRVKQQYLEYIIRGEKTLEVRVAYASIRKIETGDELMLESHHQKRKVLVHEVRRYKTFDDLLDAESSSKIVPGKSREQVISLLREIYPANKEALGVIVLELKLV